MRSQGRARRAAVMAVSLSAQSRPAETTDGPVAVLAGEDPKAVVLELVQPAVAGRDLEAEHRLGGQDEAGG